MELVAVGADEDVSLGDLDTEVDTLVRREPSQQIDHLTRDPPERLSRQVQVHAAGLDSRQVEEVVD